MITYYVLDGQEPRPTTDVLEWARGFAENDHLVVATGLGKARVSTVFLGIDHHQFGDAGPPRVFETMIFDGPHDGWCERSSTWEEAEAVHARAVLLARKGQP